MRFIFFFIIMISYSVSQAEIIPQLNCYTSLVNIGLEGEILHGNRILLPIVNNNRVGFLVFDTYSGTAQLCMIPNNSKNDGFRFSFDPGNTYEISSRVNAVISRPLNTSNSSDGPQYTAPEAITPVNRLDIIRCTPVSENDSSVAEVLRTDLRTRLEGVSNSYTARAETRVGFERDGLPRYSSALNTCGRVPGLRRKAIKENMEIIRFNNRSSPVVLPADNSRVIE